MQIDQWSVAYTATDLQVGPLNRPIEWWRDAGSKEFVDDSCESLFDWWQRWKSIILSIIDLSPAVSTDG